MQPREIMTVVFWVVMAIPLSESQWLQTWGYLWEVPWKHRCEPRKQLHQHGTRIQSRALRATKGLTYHVQEMEYWVSRKFSYAAFLSTHFSSNGNSLTVDLTQLQNLLTVAWFFRENLLMIKGVWMLEFIHSRSNVNWLWPPPNIILLRRKVYLMKNF